MTTTKEDIELRIKTLYNRQDAIENKMEKLQEQHDAIDTQIHHLECNLAKGLYN
jgi:chaperonin cofactor prefoldin